MTKPTLILAAMLGAAALRAQAPSLSQPNAANAANAAAAAGMTVNEAMAIIQKQSDQPQPSGLSPADRDAYNSQTEWLRDVHKRIVSLGSASSVQAPRDRASGMATGRTARDQATGQASGRREASSGQTSGQAAAPASNKPLDDLKAKIEEEARRFQTLSNASRARHDIAMNAIRNMKG